MSIAERIHHDLMQHELQSPRPDRLWPYGWMNREAYRELLRDYPMHASSLNDQTWVEYHGIRWMVVDDGQPVSLFCLRSYNRDLLEVDAVNLAARAVIRREL